MSVNNIFFYQNYSTTYLINIQQTNQLNFILFSLRKNINNLIL